MMMRRTLALITLACLCSCNSEPAKPSGGPAPAPAPGNAGGQPASADVATFTVEGNDQMQYNVKQLEVKPGQKVRVVFKNVGQLPKAAMGHNFVVLRKGVTLEQFTPKVAQPHGTIENDFLPEEARKDVLAHTKLLGPGEQDTTEFTAPGLPGELVYLCTFPAHATLMNGKVLIK
jgi:azurin